MQGVGNPLAALAGLSGLSGVLNDVAKAPIARWNQSSLWHKVIAAGAGAGLAYYLHTRGMADTAVAVAGVAGAYATSMLMHYPAVARQAMAGPVASNAQPLPPEQVQAMNQVAQQMLGQGLAGGLPAQGFPAGPRAQMPVPGAPVRQQPPMQQRAGMPVMPTQQSAVRYGGGKWDLLSAEL